MAKKSRLEVLLDEEDRIDLETMRDVHRVRSLGAAVRACIRAAATKLGMRKREEFS
jgi:hypothetical protein